MIADDALRTRPTLQGQQVVLRPLEPEHAEAFWQTLGDPEVRRLIGTHTDVQRDAIDAWLATRADQPDRLDLAIHRRDDAQFIGELALTELDPANETAGIRIALADTALAGKGYGSDAMRTILGHAFDTVGIHRNHLDVYAFNTHAIRTYERLEFTHEGRTRQALLWDGKRHDTLIMSMLRPEWEATQPRHPGQAVQRATPRQSSPDETVARLR